MIVKKKRRMEPVRIDLTGPEGNAHVLIGYARLWASQLGFNAEEVTKKMTSGDYENLINVLEEYFGSHIILER